MIEGENNGVNQPHPSVSGIYEGDVVWTCLLVCNVPAAIYVYKSSQMWKLCPPKWHLLSYRVCCVEIICYYRPSTLNLKMTNSLRRGHILWMSCFWNHHEWVISQQWLLLSVPEHMVSVRAGSLAFAVKKPTVKWRALCFDYFLWQQVCKFKLKIFLANTVLQVPEDVCQTLTRC